MNNLGIYLHVPFCRAKCPYCDFYSLVHGEQEYERYTQVLLQRITAFPQSRVRKIQSVYFGGGTPDLLGSDRLCRILQAVLQKFPAEENCEITVEVNPFDCSPDDPFFSQLHRAGFNRISLGMQSACDEELAILGRQHRHKNTVQAFSSARKAGFTNISLDLMLALPKSRIGQPVQQPVQWQQRLDASLAACKELACDHVSAYLLKVEEGTFYYRNRSRLQLWDDDCAAEQYLYLCRALQASGFAQYEISNFARPGKESRHNLLYWHCAEYLGFGPAAHSFFDGRRFYFPRDLADFCGMQGSSPVPQAQRSFAGAVDDGTGGDFNEYAMLALRLCEGLRQVETVRRYGEAGEKAFAAMYKKAGVYVNAGLVQQDEHRICFTPAGFLVSNALLTHLLSTDTPPVWPVIPG